MTMATAPAMGHNTAPATPMGQMTNTAMGSVAAQCLGPSMGPMVPNMDPNTVPNVGPHMGPHMGSNNLPAMDPKSMTQGSWESGTLPQCPAPLGPLAPPAPPAPNDPPPQKTIASNLSEVDRGRIVGMWEAGRKATAIAAAIPCSKRTACKWINAYRNCGKDGLIDLRRNGLAGRPRKTTEDENRAIIKAMDENHGRAATSSALAALKLRVSDRTIRRRLQEARAERRKRAAHSNRNTKANTVKAKKAKPVSVNAEPVLTPLNESLQDTLQSEVKPMTFVEVRMDTQSLPDSGTCCYVDL